MRYIVYNALSTFRVIKMSGQVEFTLKCLSENSVDVLNSLYSPLNAFDFSKIIPLPSGHDKIHDLQNKEALYYFLTDRMSKTLERFEARMYFIDPHIPDLKAPSINNVISFTENYLSKFKDDGTFDCEVNAGYYPFPHKTLDDLFETGKAIAGMIDQFNIDNLSYWRYQKWGSYTNALRATRVNDNTISFQTLSADALKVVRELISKYKLSAFVKITSIINDNVIDEFSFVDGKQVALQADQ